MKMIIRVALVALAILSAAPARGQITLGTAFEYQGSLNEGGTPANGPYDFEFRLWDDPTTGSQLGSTQEYDAAGLGPVALTGGLFSVSLDFGDQFTGDARWLAISVRQEDPGDTAPYTTLTPRVRLNPVPYAMYATRSGETDSVADGSIDAGDFAPGSVSRLDAPDGDPAPAVMVDDAGLVGIGTSMPNEKLDVVGNVKTSGYFQAGSLSLDDSVLLSKTNLRFGATGLSSTINNVGGGPIVFQTNGGSGSTDRMRIEANGNVGVNGMIGVGDRVEVSASGSRTTRIIDNAVEFESPGTLKPFAIASTVLGEKGIRLTTLDDNQHRFFFGENGEMGIGTINPAATLDVYGSATFRQPVTVDEGASRRILVDDNRIDFRNDLLDRWLMYLDQDGDDGLFFWNSTKGVYRFFMADNGNTGFNTATPAEKLHMVGNSRFDGAMDVRGRITTNQFTIDGGMDIAEPFEAVEIAEIQPGMVLCMDPEREGGLRISRRAYDRTVAGAVSGAGGIDTGMMLTQTGAVGEASVPVALTGRVHVLCDADANGAVRPGDLLTTSDTPGHAMRATDTSRAFGSTLGKAMGSLESGKGLVLTLVSLQ